MEGGGHGAKGCAEAVRSPDSAGVGSLIKKFNSAAAALASEHSEVRPCESWRRLIRRRQILSCRGSGAGQPRQTAAAQKARLEGGWHPACSETWPTLLHPPAAAAEPRVTGPQSGGKSQGLSCPHEAAERVAAGLNKG